MCVVMEEEEEEEEEVEEQVLMKFSSENRTIPAMICYYIILSLVYTQIYTQASDKICQRTRYMLVTKEPLHNVHASM